MLPLAIFMGAAAYFIYRSIDFLAPAGPFLYSAVKHIQPLLIFLMLFLAFCKVEPSQMRPHRWQSWLLLVQAGSLVLVSVILIVLPDFSWRCVIEAGLLCLICPTATACVVVTGKLGGDMPGVVTYTVLINLVVSLLVPLFFPLVHPQEGMDFFQASYMIMGKVFPVLIIPCLLAWIVRYFLPRFHAWLMRFPDLPFYIWAFSLSLAILMSTREVIHSGASLFILLSMAVVTLLCCIFQFQVGKLIGRRYGEKITAGQALGQKNTVLAIWMGYTFLTPVTSLAGGLYSIWHNVYNSWQLNKERHLEEAGFARPHEEYHRHQNL